MTFDLIGLPPTPAEILAFVADPAPMDAAYARVVDRLLASPDHGERWARHWMDVVRFAETSGHEFDYNIPFAYRYRDYLIRAFNQDSAVRPVHRRAGGRRLARITPGATQGPVHE